MNKNVTNEKALSICRDLKYEIGMMYSMVNEIDKSGGIGNIHNALVESFAIHTINLIAFLYVDETTNDDVIATNFFNNPSKWIKIRPPISKILSDAKRKTHKTVAHLTYKRLDYFKNDSGWDYKSISHHINIILLIFLHHADENRIGGMGKEFVKAALSKSITYNFIDSSVYIKPKFPCFASIPLEVFYTK